MRVVISQGHISLSRQLARESNKLAGNFNNEDYSRIENIDNLLLKRDISVEKKKNLLINKLHESIAKAFSINKRNFSKKNFDSLRKKLHNIRRIVLKLRSINYYLETAFLSGLKLAKIRIKDKNSNLMRQENLAADELEALEFTAYRLMGEVVVLDKRLLKGYAHREKKVLKEEKSDAKDLGLLLKKESELLEHLEAKLPPPKAATIKLVKEPAFTHWVARVFALLSYLEHLCRKEAAIFSKLKRNKSAKNMINKKILHLLEEKSKLLRIMEEKTISMKRLRTGSLKRELRNFTTTINL